MNETLLNVEKSFQDQDFHCSNEPTFVEHLLYARCGNTVTTEKLIPSGQAFRKHSPRSIVLNVLFTQRDALPIFTSIALIRSFPHLICTVGIAE
jgi:hypothetical protein